MACGYTETSSNIGCMWVSHHCASNYPHVLSSSCLHFPPIAHTCVFVTQFFARLSLSVRHFLGLKAKCGKWAESWTRTWGQLLESTGGQSLASNERFTKVVIYLIKNTVEQTESEVRGEQYFYFHCYLQSTGDMQEVLSLRNGPTKVLKIIQRKIDDSIAVVCSCQDKAT